jgi:hypothetical protein
VNVGEMVGVARAAGVVDGSSSVVGPADFVSIKA